MQLPECMCVYVSVCLRVCVGVSHVTHSRSPRISSLVAIGCINGSAERTARVQMGWSPPRLTTSRNMQRVPSPFLPSPPLQLSCLPLRQRRLRRLAVCCHTLKLIINDFGVITIILPKNLVPARSLFNASFSLSPYLSLALGADEEMKLLAWRMGVGANGKHSNTQWGKMAGKTTSEFMTWAFQLNC